MDERDEKRAVVEAWMPTVTRLCTLGLGSFILVWQTVFENLDRPYLIGGGLTLLLGGGVGLWLELTRRGS
jgi:hypothetical protein